MQFYRFDYFHDGFEPVIIQKVMCGGYRLSGIGCPSFFKTREAGYFLPVHLAVLLEQAIALLYRSYLANLLRYALVPPVRDIH